MKNNLLSERLVYNGESQTPTHLHLCTYNALVMQEVSRCQFPDCRQFSQPRADQLAAGARTSEHRSHPGNMQSL